jgi:hypothetical protein
MSTYASYVELILCFPDINLQCFRHGSEGSPGFSGHGFSSVTWEWAVYSTVEASSIVP